jgi:hypothetical protein
VALEFEHIAVLNSNSGLTVTCLVKTPACVREMTMRRITDGVVNCRFLRDLRMVEIIVQSDCSKTFEIDFVIEFDADPEAGLHLPGTASATLCCTWEDSDSQSVDFSKITRQISTGGVS